MLLTVLIKEVNSFTVISGMVTDSWCHNHWEISGQNIQICSKPYQYAHTSMEAEFLATKKQFVDMVSLSIS